MSIRVGSLEPSNEVAVNEVEPKESNCHGVCPLLIDWAVTGWRPGALHMFDNAILGTPAKLGIGCVSWVESS